METPVKSHAYLSQYGLLQDILQQKPVAIEGAGKAGLTLVVSAFLLYKRG